MNTFDLQRAAALSPAELGSCASHMLPTGFPFLVNTTTGEVIAPVLFFLCDQHIRANGRYVRNTCIAIGEDLKDWWRYLDEFGIDWTSVTREDVEAYRDAMYDTLSPYTHKPYGDSTVRRRLGTVCAFYKWAFAEGATQVASTLFDTVSTRYVAVDSDSLAHMRVRRPRLSTSLVPSRTRANSKNHRSTNRVKVMLGAEVQTIFQNLGPLPSKREPDDPRPSRDRLCAELCIQAGLRVDEATSLTIYQILELTFDPDDSLATVPLLLRKTKGGRPRTVPLPVSLLKELLLYISHERKQAVDTRKARHRKSQSTIRLFVNGLNAGGNVGNPMQAKTAQRAFESAVLQSGLVVRENRTNPDNPGEPYVRQIAKYTYHCLRHTFVGWSYYARKKAGDTDPWPAIASIVGHTDSAITRKHYHTACSEYEAQISDKVQRIMKDLRNA